MLTKIVLSDRRDRLARNVKELKDAANEILITKIILPKKKKNTEMPLHLRKKTKNKTTTTTKKKKIERTKNSGKKLRGPSFGL